jgi:hypothetical protein
MEVVKKHRTFGTQFPNNSIYSLGVIDDKQSKDHHKDWEIWEWLEETPAL